MNYLFANLLVATMVPFRYAIGYLGGLLSVFQTTKVVKWFHLDMQLGYLGGLLDVFQTTSLEPYVGLNRNLVSMEIHNC